MGKLSEKTLVSLQVVAVIISFAVWITRVSEKVERLMDDKKELIDRLITLERRTYENTNTKHFNSGGM
jgi:hypothetical protein